MSTPPNTYTDTPIAGHVLANDQPVMRSNYTYLVNTLGTSNSKNGDHQVSFGGVDTNSFEGRHRQVCFNNRHGSAPTVAGISDGVNSLLYSDNGNIFFGSATGAGAYQLTTYNGGTNGHGGGFGSNVTGWTFLPGGLILQYGSNTITGSSSPQTITFPISFPSSVLSVVTTGFSSNDSANTINITAGSITLTQFQIFNSASTSVVLMNWLALGN